MRLPFGLNLTRRKLPNLEASFDAAQTNVDNEIHWAATDHLSPNASTQREVLSRLRMRSRYEASNNSFAKGIVQTLANDAIGTGPRLQLTNSSDLESNREIEAGWTQWCVDTKFCEKLRTMRVAKAVDGEAIGRFVTNNRLSGVRLDIRLYESDHLTDPWLHDVRVINDTEVVDGILLDSNFNPTRYHLLKHHPGGQFFNRVGNTWEGDWFSRDKIIHLFREDRPGQRRGVPELTPSLPLFAMLRRYSLSTVAAAETAADLAAVLKTDSSAVDQAQSVQTGVSFPIRRRTIMSLPFGWEIQQLRAEQPTTTYKEFRDAVLNEIARCLGVPFNIAAGNSAGYNFSSGRLDHQIYFRNIDIERKYFEENLLERTFSLWLQEFLSLRSGIRASDIDLSLYPHRWHWDPKPAVDPLKEANAKIALWEKGLLTDDQYLLEEGIDPETHYGKLEESIARRREIGLPIPGVATQEIRTDEEGQESEQLEEAQSED